MNERARRRRPTGMGRAMSVMVIVLIMLSTIGIGAPAVRANPGQGKSFTFLQAGYTQEIASTSSEFMGGVAFAPDGDPIVDRCSANGGALTRFDRQGTPIQINSTNLYPGTTLTSNAGCGLTNHPDGTLYSNTSLGISNLDPNTGAPLRPPFGPAGNVLGIAADPQTRHLVYVGASCNASGSCPLIDIDPVTGASRTFATLAGADSTFVDGIYFEPNGNYLFLANRRPQYRLTILTRSGALVRHVALSGEPDGVSFRAVVPKFILTNNNDGTITRFDFPNDDFTQPPTQSVFASGGFRGDLAQVGPDSCVYLTQQGTRYDNGVTTGQNCLVRICPGFAPPPGVQPKDPIILIPGTSGTELKNVPDGELWPAIDKLLISLTDDHLLNLQLAPDGVTPFSPDPHYDVSIGDIVRKPFGHDVYDGTIKGLTAAGYKVYPFPWDWRKDSRLTLARLVARIDQIRAEHGVERVDIVAHSQGGHVLQNFLADSRSVGKVRRAVTLGTPILGATMALGLLEYQMPCFLESLSLCLTNPATLQTVLANAGGAYQLLPSPAFDDAVGPPLKIDFDADGDGEVEGIQGYDRWSAPLRAHGRNGALLDMARSFHVANDLPVLADAAVQLVRVVGDNLNTVQQIRDYKGCTFYDPSSGGAPPLVICDVVEHELVINKLGDNTVPLHR